MKVPKMSDKPADKNPHAVALGRNGGLANTPAQNTARARNGKLGGRPRGRIQNQKPASMSKS
jgi:hypothetical protein